MALTSAEKQRRYRDRHLGVDGTKERIQLFISVQAKAQLGRLACHHGYTVTKVIEKLAADAERALISRLPARQHTRYLDSHQKHLASHRGTRAKAKSSKKSSSARSSPRRKVTV
jgi:hypothetical protein